MYFIDTRPSNFPSLGARPSGASTDAERLTLGAYLKYGDDLGMALFIRVFADSCLSRAIFWNDDIIQLILVADLFRFSSLFNQCPPGVAEFQGGGARRVTLTKKKDEEKINP
jgi:hypothetical protein